MIGRVAWDDEEKIFGEVFRYNPESMRVSVLWEDGSRSRGIHLAAFHVWDSGFAFI